jgi:hypothetical protein
MIFEYIEKFKYGEPVKKYLINLKVLVSGKDLNNNIA